MWKLQGAKLGNGSSCNRIISLTSITGTMYGTVLFHRWPWSLVSIIHGLTTIFANVHYNLWSQWFIVWPQKFDNDHHDLRSQWFMVWPRMFANDHHDLWSQWFIVWPRMLANDHNDLWSQWFMVWPRMFANDHHDLWSQWFMVWPWCLLMTTMIYGHNDSLSDHKC